VKNAALVVVVLLCMCVLTIGCRFVGAGSQ